MIHYNKWDLPDVLLVQALCAQLDVGGMPDFEAVATCGEGIELNFLSWR